MLFKLVNSLSTAQLCGNCLLGRRWEKRLFSKKTNAGENLSEQLRLVWACGSESRAFGSLKGLKSKVKLIAQMICVTCRIMMLLSSVSRQKAGQDLKMSMYATACLASCQDSSRRHHWKLNASLLCVHLCFSFMLNMSQPLGDEADFSCYSSH